MSPDPTSPNTHTYRAMDDDERDMLESLKGLSIKGFYDWYSSGHFPRDDTTHRTRRLSNDTTPNANTPSSTNASLPTPPALKSSHIFLASPESPFGHAWYSEDRAIPAPNAPLMKDLDSFTDGTGQGSFDFPLAPAGDELLPLIFHPATEYDDIETPTAASMAHSLALDLLPSPSDPNDAVLAWIEGISATTPADLTSSSPPKKRRRSFTQDSETSETPQRRTRAWSPTIESGDFPPRESKDCKSYPNTRAEPGAPG